ncbi:M1 family aminopeptidase [Bacteroidota bacterium]
MSDLLCSGHHTYDMLNVPTHVQDSGLLQYDVNHYGISLEVNDTSTYISGYTEILATALDAIDELVFELNSVQEVDSIFLNEQKINSYTHANNLIKIAPGVNLMKDNQFKARVHYHGAGGQNGFYSGISNRKDGEWGSSVTYTLSEPFRASDWFVCKQVLNDKADSADIYISVAQNLKAGSNGILMSIDSLSGTMHRYHWRSRYPIAYYLLSFSVSKYRDYSFYAKASSLQDSLLIQNYIYDVPGYLEQNKERIDKTGEMIGLFSNIFIPYPFQKEKYGHCLAPLGGGMEHQTMTSLSGFGFNLVAHELAHQWFGDNVTCASWQDIWINEGFASYGEYLALETLKSRTEADLWMRQAHDWAFKEPAGSVYIPVEDADKVYRIFSNSLSYKKGAALIHMIRYEIGDDRMFFKIMANFQNLFADSVATGQDFLDVLNESSELNFDGFFEQWYYGQGFPQFQFFWWQTNDSLMIDIRQSGSSQETPFFKIPIDISLQFEDGRDSVVRIICDNPEMMINIPINRPVINLVPDPENWILDKSQVTRKVVPNGYFSVNPNPFGDNLNIVFHTGIGNRDIILSDLSGKVLEKHFSQEAKFILNTQGLRQGLYLLQVLEGDESYTTRIVRQ